MEFHNHRLQIRVLLDDEEEKKLRELAKARAEELHMDVSEDTMLKKLIEESITEKLSK
ncbi:MAG: hypothetical protein K5744_11400 [Eubacterium sp.]|jgi:hypothetical protein|uniref:Uncharacterized protein n=1 Tax=Eubacterium cellulosolvens (strain ATCC 43171 / JCM 9499 / 6) TaxID=633697 RepID=I5AUB5_EUBC6|nr:hypothetical protein [Eubacterium sp.]